MIGWYMFRGFARSLGSFKQSLGLHEGFLGFLRGDREELTEGVKTWTKTNNFLEVIWTHDFLLTYVRCGLPCLTHA